MLGDVGLTTAKGVDSRTGTAFEAGENIYGPFEAGFSSQQDNILSSLGCNPGSLGHVAGGIDTYTAEQMVAKQCNVQLPRVEGSKYISLLDECGGHTNEYHFHERLSCLYSTDAGSTHSTQVGQGLDGKFLYGKWEDFGAQLLPDLDACGGHFGSTPDSADTVYHYHVQDRAPFTFGCYGPTLDSAGNYKMVTVAECRQLYSGCDGDIVAVSTPSGEYKYDLWCPCFDATGSNADSQELPVFSMGAERYTCRGDGCLGTSSVGVGGSSGGSDGSGSSGGPDATDSAGGSTGGSVDGSLPPDGALDGSGMQVGVLPPPPPSDSAGGDGGAGVGGGTTGGGTGNVVGGVPPSGGGTVSTTCNASPCTASMLGDVGFTTAAGTDDRTGAKFEAGENIYGPFEAGFSDRQDNILSALGCNPGSLGHVPGGVDTYTAEQMVAHQCGVTLPRVEGDRYISLLDECGGHTNEYHFHERMSCLYATPAGSGHSTQVGVGLDGRLLYGKWESFVDQRLPLLDACGGHFGVTPDSAAATYHYHVQDRAPFTFGCFGPAKGMNGYTMVTLAECRKMYSGCGDGDAETIRTASGSFEYDFWCPCFDADGSNVGTKELPIFSQPESAWTCTGADCIATTSDTTSFIDPADDNKIFAPGAPGGLGPDGNAADGGAADGEGADGSGLDNDGLAALRASLGLDGDSNITSVSLRSSCGWASLAAAGATLLIA